MKNPSTAPSWRPDSAELIERALNYDLEAVRELLHRAREGDKAPFNTVMRHYWTVQMRLVTASFGRLPQEMREDIVQKAFTEFFNAGGFDQEIRNVKNLLFTIVRRRTFAQLKRQARHPEHSLDELELSSYDDHQIAPMDFRNGAPPAVDPIDLEAGDRRHYIARHVRRALAHDPDKVRVFELIPTHKALEIAQEMNQKLKWVYAVMKECEEIALKWGHIYERDAAQRLQPTRQTRPLW